MSSENFRAVNRAMGIQPKIGPFALHQLVPFLSSLLVSFLLKDLLGLSWLMAALLVGGITGGSIALMGNSPWRLFAQLVSVPYLVRGGAFYQPLLGPKQEVNWSENNRSS